MFCEKCGNQLDSDAMFCDACGAKVESKVEPNNSPIQQSKVPSPAMNSINNMYNGAKTYINNSGLDGWQITCCILSALSVVFSLITYNFIYNWITTLCAGFMLFLCIKKEEYSTVLSALPFTVYFGKELIFWLIRKAPYLAGFNMFLGVLFFIIDTVALICYWLLATDKLSQKKPAIWMVLGMLGLNIIGILYNLFGGSLYYFKNYIYYLSIGTFLMVYLLMIIKKEFLTSKGDIFTNNYSTENASTSNATQYTSPLSPALQEYSRLGGFLKFIVIMYKYIGPIGLVITVISSSITYIKTIRVLSSFSGYGYYNASGDIAKSVLLMIVAIATSVFGIIVCIKFAKKIENKESDFLHLFQLLYIIATALLMVSAIISGGNIIANMISYLILQVIVFLIWNTYFTKSVRVAVFMGSDEYLRKSIFNKNTRYPLSK